MKLFPFLTLTGILSFIAYGISRTLFASRLQYIIQGAQVNADQLGLLVTVTNPEAESFTQKNLVADVLINGKKVSTISNDQILSIPSMEVTPQGWLVQLDQNAPADIKIIQLRGQVQIDNLVTPLDMKFKFI